MTTFSKRKWYADGLRFSCRMCGTCCTGEPGYVWVLPSEAERIAKFLQISLDEFAAKYLRKAGSHDSLIELPDGRCIFYGNRTCIIYPVRPIQCRTFPFWDSIIATPEAWERCGRTCPGIDKDELHSAEEIERIVRSSSTDAERPIFERPQGK